MEVLNWEFKIVKSDSFWYEVRRWEKVTDVIINVCDTVRTAIAKKKSFTIDDCMECNKDCKIKE